MLLFYAVTNMHLFNIVNVKMSYFQNEDADLIVRESNRISKSFLENIINLGIFNHVEKLPLSLPSEKPLKSQKIIILRKINTFFYMTKDSKYNLICMNNIFGNREYSQIFIANLAIQSWGLLILLCLLSKNQYLKISILEEGAGDLYKTNDELFYNSFEGSMVYKYISFIAKCNTNKKKLLKNINNIYLYMPEIYNSNNKLIPLKIPVIDSNNKCVIDLLTQEISNLDYSEYVKRTFYYFVTTDALTGNFNDIYDQIDSLITNISRNNVVIKDHPSIGKINPNAFKKYMPEIYVDQRNYLFESILPALDLNKKVFITYGSATVLHPKYMFGKEPYVIFTFNLTQKSKSFFNEKTAYDLQSNYSDKRKIFVPNSLDEMKEIIIKINHELMHN